MSQSELMRAENETILHSWQWDRTPWAFIHTTTGGWTELDWETLTERILAQKHNTLLYWYSLVYSENTYVNIPPKQYSQALLLRNCFRTMRVLWDMGYCWGTFWLGMQESWGGRANLPQSIETHGVTNYPIPSPQTLPAFQMAHLTLLDGHKGRAPEAGHTSSPMACVTVYTAPSPRH